MRGRPSSRCKQGVAPDVVPTPPPDAASMIERVLATIPMPRDPEEAALRDTARAAALSMRLVSRLLVEPEDPLFRWTQRGSRSNLPGRRARDDGRPARSPRGSLLHRADDPAIRPAATQIAVQASRTSCSAGAGRSRSKPTAATTMPDVQWPENRSRTGALVKRGSPSRRRVRVRSKVAAIKVSDRRLISVICVVAVPARRDRDRRVHADLPRIVHRVQRRCRSRARSGPGPAQAGTGSSESPILPARGTLSA
jgi:hypothetical protein